MGRFGIGFATPDGLSAKLRRRTQFTNDGEPAPAQSKSRVKNISRPIGQKTRTLSLSTTTFVSDTSNVKHNSKCFGVIRALSSIEKEERVGGRGRRKSRDPRCACNHKIADDRAAGVVLKPVTLTVATTKMARKHVKLESVGHAPYIDDGLKDSS